MKRIFTVGVPRSGTTLCQTLLMASGQLVSFTESHYLSSLPPSNSPFRWVAFLVCFWRLRRWARRNGFSVAPKPVFRREAAIAMYLNLLDAEARARGSDGWVDKTPAHLRVVQALRAHSRQLRFIFCYRDGAGCVDSLAKVLPEWRGEPDESDRAYAIARWLHDSALCHLRFDADDSFNLVYEQLLGDEESVVSSLYAFLGLAQVPAGDRPALSTLAAQVTDESELWKGNNLRRSGVEPGGELPTQNLEALTRLVDELR